MSCSNKVKSCKSCCKNQINIFLEVRTAYLNLFLRRSFEWHKCIRNISCRPSFILSHPPFYLHLFCLFLVSLLSIILYLFVCYFFLSFLCFCTGLSAIFSFLSSLLYLFCHFLLSIFLYFASPF